MKHGFKSASALCGLLFLVASPATHAQSSVVSKVNPEIGPLKVAVSSYWTPERFRDAKPLPMPQLRAGIDTHGKDALPSPQPFGQPAGAEGQPPSEELLPPGQQLYVPGPDSEHQLLDDSREPQATATFGAHYTSSRVFPQFTGAAAPFSADRAYPYRTVGKLFVSINGSPYVCSASVIQRRVVATAGHCVHNGSGTGFHDNFVFVPAFRDGTAPFNAWHWQMVTTTQTWATGGGSMPNAADYAMIVVSDQSLTPGGPVVRIGEVTGWLGWQVSNLLPNHTSKLGYPCNLDNCGKMQVVTGGSFRAMAPNNVEYGSDARGGSSGGPWVMNLGVVPVGGGSGQNAAFNRVVGVTSYGYNSLDAQVQGASVLDKRWFQLLSAVCAGAGNCN